MESGVGWEEVLRCSAIELRYGQVLIDAVWIDDFRQFGRMVDAILWLMMRVTILIVGNPNGSLQFGYLQDGLSNDSE
jgi:hypothetical protein